MTQPNYTDLVHSSVPTQSEIVLSMSLERAAMASRVLNLTQAGGDPIKALIYVCRSIPDYESIRKQRLDSFSDLHAYSSFLKEQPRDPDILAKCYKKMGEIVRNCPTSNIHFLAMYMEGARTNYDPWDKVYADPNRKISYDDLHEYFYCCQYIFFGKTWREHVSF